MPTLFHFKSLLKFSLWGYAALTALTIGGLSPAALAQASESMPEVVPLVGSWQFSPESPAVQPWSIASASPLLRPSATAQWSPIVVPANWSLTGHDLSGAVWYRYFLKGNPQLSGKTVQLQFEGVDYAADVWLNGQYLGFHEGYFEPFHFDVSKLLYFDRSNELLVRVNSPKERDQPDWSLHKRLIKGVLGHHDARPGGAWSPQAQDQNTGGIWAPVTLKVSDRVTIQQVQVTPHLNPDQSQATAEVSLDIAFSGKATEAATLQLQLSPENFAGVPEPVQLLKVQLNPGHNRVKAELSVKQPQIWQTWDQGSPNLYALTVQALQDHRPSDRSKTVFGFRTIAFDPVVKVWKLNGRRIFLRGTNYIASQWLSEMTPEKYQVDLELMKKANINAVRVHAHVSGQAFYDLSDRAGLLLWQDFPLQWGYTEDPEFEAEAVTQAKSMVTLLYNHPSIMAWSLHNEPPWNADWMKYKYKSYRPTQNQRLDRQLFESLQGFDPTRHLHAYSGLNEHPWWGWYSNTVEKYREPTTQSIITEFGAQALPDLSSLRRMFLEAQLWPKTEADWQLWEYHNFQRHETFDIAKVSMGKNPEEFVANTQRYQALVNQVAAESYRLQRYQPVSSIFQFMFVECWPSINWGVVDYWRNPKSGYFALQQAYQPILPVLDRPPMTLPVGSMPPDLSIINDLWKGFPQAKLNYTLLQDHAVLDSAVLPVDLAPDSLQRLRHSLSKPLKAGRYELQLKVTDHQDRFLGQNAYRFEVSLK